MFFFAFGRLVFKVPHLARGQEIYNQYSGLYFNSLKIIPHKSTALDHN